MMSPQTANLQIVPSSPDGNPSTDVRTARGAAPPIVRFMLRKGRARVQCIGRTIHSVTSRRDSTVPRPGARVAGNHQDPSTDIRRGGS